MSISEANALQEQRADREDGNKDIKEDITKGGMAIRSKLLVTYLLALLTMASNGGCGDSKATDVARPGLWCLRLVGACPCTPV